MIIMMPMVLFLGNSIWSDDRIGILVGERLKDRLKNEGYEVEITEESGFSLMDLIAGRDTVIIVDSMRSGKHPIGEVLLIEPENFEQNTFLSPHYTGLPEILLLMELLDLNKPRRVYIIGIEIGNSYTMSEELSDDLRLKVEHIIEKVYNTIMKISKT
jgi:hydrogenase maturation protease